MKLILSAVALAATATADINFAKIQDDLLQLLENEGVFSITEDSIMVNIEPYGRVTAIQDESIKVEYGTDYANHATLAVSEDGYTLTHAGLVSNMGDLAEGYEDYTSFTNVLSMGDPEFFYNDLFDDGFTIEGASNVDGHVAEGSMTLFASGGASTNQYTFSLEFDAFTEFSAGYPQDLKATTFNDWYGYAGPIGDEISYHAGISGEAALGCVEQGICDGSVTAEAGWNENIDEVTVSFDLGNIGSCIKLASNCDASISNNGRKLRLNIEGPYLKFEAINDDVVSVAVRVATLNRKKAKIPANKIQKKFDNPKFLAVLSWVTVEYNVADVTEGWELIVRAPTHNRRIFLKKAAKQILAGFQPLIDDFSGSTAEGLPNALYGIAYLDKVLAGTQGLYDLTPLDTALSFRAPTIGVTDEAVEEAIALVSEKMDEYVLIPGPTIAAVRTSVHSITGQEGRDAFELAFAATLGN